MLGGLTLGVLRWATERRIVGVNGTVVGLRLSCNSTLGVIRKTDHLG